MNEVRTHNFSGDRYGSSKNFGGLLPNCDLLSTLVRGLTGGSNVKSPVGVVSWLFLRGGEAANEPKEFLTSPNGLSSCCD
jgi:hypothetical protein